MCDSAEADRKFATLSMLRKRWAGYEIIFAVVIDIPLIVGGAGLLRRRRWGWTLILFAIAATPLYGAYYWRLIRCMFGRVPPVFYLAYLAAIPLAAALAYLSTKRVRESLK